MIARQVKRQLFHQLGRNGRLAGIAIAGVDAIDGGFAVGLERLVAILAGEDNIREVIEGAYNSPPGRFKIYIIDEVHMLSTAAFNALLKTLEEPPAHVKFMFATTDPEKVLPTILSRCQRFDLRRIPSSLIVLQLATIAGKEDKNKKTKSKSNEPSTAEPAS